MWKVPLFEPSLDNRELDAVQDVLRSGWLTMGEVTRDFEKRFADFLNVKHALAVSSCTAALHIANQALGIGKGDEVICPSMTFVAGANSILYTGATAVFAEITSLDDFSLSIADIEAKITKKTKAIQVVHYAGYACEMDRIMELARKYGLAVIEDAAHAPGAEYKGQKCGTFGDISCFSFFSSKNMTTAEGGMIVTEDDRLAKKIKLMRSHGMTSLTLDRYKGRSSSYDVVELGYNYRIDELRSAIGLVQLEKLKISNQQRQQVHSWYLQELKEIDQLSIPYQQRTDFSVHHILPILLNEDVDRELVQAEMKSRGIQTSVHYLPIHLFEYYRNRFDYHEGLLPITEDAARRELTLPFYPSMTKSDIEFVCANLAEAADSQ